MATLVNSSKNVLGPFLPTKLVLTASDTFTYLPGKNQELILYNITASTVVVTLDGSTGTTVLVPGAGSTTVSVASGLAVTVPANDWQIVRLDTIPAYLQGTIAMTGGVGCVAVLIS